MMEEAVLKQTFFDLGGSVVHFRRHCLCDGAGNVHRGMFMETASVDAGEGSVHMLGEAVFM